MSIVSLLSSSSCSDESDIEKVTNISTPTCDSDLLPSPQFHQSKIPKLPLKESSEEDDDDDGFQELTLNPFETSNTNEYTGEFKALANETNAVFNTLTNETKTVSSTLTQFTSIRSNNKAVSNTLTHSNSITNESIEPSTSNNCHSSTCFPRITKALASFLDISHLPIITSAAQEDDTEMFWSDGISTLWYLPFERFLDQISNEIPSAWLLPKTAIFISGKAKYFSKLSQSKQRAYKQLVAKQGSSQSLQESISLIFNADPEREFTLLCARLILTRYPRVFYSEIHGSCFLECASRLQNLSAPQASSNGMMIFRKREGAKIAKASAVWKRWLLEVLGVSEGVAQSVISVFPSLKQALDCEDLQGKLEDCVGQRIAKRISLMLCSVSGEESMN